MHCIERWAKKLSKTSPQSLFKTCLDTFGNHYGQFWIFEVFLNFLKVFEGSTLHGTLGKIFFRKNCPKTGSRQIWTFSGTILGIFGFLKNLGFFENFRRLHGTLGKKNFSKKSPKICSKHVWIHLQTILGLFGFLKFFEDSTLHGTVGKNFLSKRKPQNPFGHLGTILDISRNLKLFWFFSRIFSKYPPQNISPENWIQIF